MNRASQESGSDRRQVIGPKDSVYSFLVYPLMSIDSRFQTRTRAAGLTMRRLGQAALATVLVFVAIVLASPAAFAQVRTTSVATPALGQLVSQQEVPPGECDGAATQNTPQAQGCDFKDPRLGPAQLPPTGESDVAEAVAKITRHYHRFGPGTENDQEDAAEFLVKYWKQDTSQCSNPGPVGRAGWCYPPDDGFAGKPSEVPLMPGTLIDRFGAPTGFFLAPLGTPFAARAIPPQSLDTYPSTPLYDYNYHVYKVLKEFLVDKGRIARWFNQPGKGIQYRTCLSGTTEPYQCTDQTSWNVKYLIANGYLQEVSLSDMD